VESYVHRIGRTGRAGRSGEAILFVTPRERGMLRAIERATRQPIEAMTMPTSSQVNDQRINKFKQRIDSALASEGSDLDLFRSMLAEYEREHEMSMLDIAAALAKLLQGDAPLLMAPDPEPVQATFAPHKQKPPRHARNEDAAPPPERHARTNEFTPPRRAATQREEGFETYRIAVGHQHHVKPGNIVGAIANEAGLESRYIGRIDIRDDHSYVDLPPGMPSETLTHLQNVWVAGQRLRLTRHEGDIPLPPPIRRGFPPAGRDFDAPRPGKPRPRGDSAERFDPTQRPRPPGKRPHPRAHEATPGERPARRGPPSEHAGKAPPRKPGRK
jgi:ATP-dependent RNA helicase DeaD